MTTFEAARDLLLRHRTDCEAARREFRWPEPATFNWALDWFDLVADRRPGQSALVVLHEGRARETATFAGLRERSDRAANFLRALGVRRGDRVLVLLPNRAALWEAFLAAMKLGAVIVPATVQLPASDLQDRVDRGGVRHAIAEADQAGKLEAVRGLATRVLVGERRSGFDSWEDVAGAPDRFAADGPTRADDPLLLYFTSGTTARPKLVLHTHRTYPIGHLSTMYWIGLIPGDVHWNISSPGWAKHAWSSVFAPWNAEATVLVHESARFSARAVLDVLEAEPVTSLCAPPTVWRMLALEDLAARRVGVRELVAAGEPLNPEVIARVRAAWGLTVRDGYGQTETTAQVGNTPGQPVRPGSMGRPLPGYEVHLLDAEDRPAGEGEIAIALSPRPCGLMVGYEGDDARTSEAMRGGYYRTGDVATRDAEGHVTYVCRSDDVFKASDYRISPFELESVLVEHPAVAEAAVVPSPDPIRLAVPKAFVTLRPGTLPARDLAADVLAFVRARVAPYKRIRRLEFRELPKTVSGKIRRVDLRHLEADRRSAGGRDPHEFFEEDFE